MSEKLLTAPKALLNRLIPIIREAGEIILDIRDGAAPLIIDQKLSGFTSPVTNADKQAEAFIIKAVSELLPSVPAIGEEMVEAGQTPNIDNSEYFWLIDALDGTKAYIANEDDFTVNIALIKNDQPYLGLVYAPALGKLYGGAEQEAFLENGYSERRPIKVRAQPAKGLTVIMSKSHSNKTRMDQFLDSYKIAKREVMSSSLKICRIAEGKADLYPRLGPTHEWDIAAAHAILNAAGGCILKLDDKKPVYKNVDKNYLNAPFLAWGRI